MFDVQVYVWVATFLGTKAAFLIIAFILWRDEYHYSTDTLKKLWMMVKSLFAVPQVDCRSQSVIAAKEKHLRQ